MKKLIWLSVIVLVAGAIVTTVVVRRNGSDRAQDSRQAPPERARPAITVRAVAATRGAVQAWVFAEGTARSARREYLTFENAGRVAFIANGPDGGELREGDPVVAGTLLARQDQRQFKADITAAESSVREARTQLRVTEAELDQARTDEALARTTFERFAALLAQNSASRQEYDEAKAQAMKAEAAVARALSRIDASRAQIEAAESKVDQARIALEETELHAPIDGVVAYLNIEEGSYFMPSLVRTDDETAALQSVPMVIIDPSVFEVLVNIPSFERQRIKPGQVALITAGAQSIESLSGRAFSTEHQSDALVHGEVYSVNPAISPGGRSIQVRIRTTRAGAQLDDGMFVTVWIATEQREDVVVAPLNVFTYRDNQPLVFIVDEAVSTVRLKPVTLGLQGFGVQEIVDGVDAGSLLVTDGRFQLSNGAAVTVLRGPATATGGE